MSTERDHLDAETLAAWMDGGLDPASRAAAEAHASNCERCQVLLATTVKTMPVRLKADTTGATEVVSGFSQTGARGFSRIRWWLAPIAATAAAVTIWMVVPRDNPTPQQAAPQQESRVADARDAIAPAAPAPEPPPPSPAAASAEAPTATAERQKVSAEPERAPLGAVADAAITQKDASAKRENTFARNDTAKAQAPPPSPAAPAEFAPAAPAAPAVGRERRAETLQESVRAAPLTKETAGKIEVISPNPASRWRIAQGFLERSEDGGASWLPMRPVGPDQIRAGSSPSRLVCWLVGARGLVLLATDGTNFTRLPFPEQTDLATVTATSAAAAAITTADGRTFVTANAGRTWNPR